MIKTRRENVTEMILEPVTGLQQEDYEIDLEGAGGDGGYRPSEGRLDA